VVALQHNQITCKSFVLKLSDIIPGLFDNYAGLFQTVLRRLPIMQSRLHHRLGEDDVHLDQQIKRGLLVGHGQQLHQLFIGFVDVSSLQARVNYLYLESDSQLPVAELVKLLGLCFEGLDAIVILLQKGCGLLDILLLVLDEMLQSEFFGQIQH